MINLAALLQKLPPEALPILEKIAGAALVNPNPLAVLRAAEEATRQEAFDAAMSKALPGPYSDH